MKDSSLTNTLSHVNERRSACLPVNSLTCLPVNSLTCLLVNSLTHLCTKKKNLLFFLFALLATAAAPAQSVQYAYDEAGNRISRTIKLVATLRGGEADPDAEATSPLQEHLASGLTVTIYPNPTDGQLQVELSGTEAGETAQLTLFDLNGQKLLQTTAASCLTPVDLSKHPAGVYVLILVVRGRTAEYKIVKQ